MKIKYTVASFTKAGSQLAEMEDAAYPDAGPGDAAAVFTCAVADGATQGSHSGPWARLLCEEFVNYSGDASPTSVLDDVVLAARQRFVAWEAQYLEHRVAAGRPLAWFEEEVTQSGAFATLVGLRLVAPPAAATAKGEPAASFSAVAVGDSCLFVVRQERLTLSFPLDDSQQFAGAPLLIASRAASNAQMLTGIRHVGGELQAGDELYLCTDALAAWILREKERGGAPLARLRQLAEAGDTPAFAAFLGDLRQARQIRNDDVTLAHVVLEA